MHSTTEQPAELDRLRRRLAELESEVQELRHAVRDVDPCGDRAERATVQELRTACENLAERERRLRLILDSATEYAIITLDREGRVTEWNEGARRILGFEPAQIVGQNVSLIFTAEDRDRGMPAREMRAAVENGRADDERWHVHTNGARLWCRGQIMPVRNRHGAVAGFLKILRDHTAEHRAAEALRDREDRLRLAVEAAELGTWDFDPVTKAIAWSDRCKALFGLPPDATVDWDTYRAGVHPDDRERVFAADRQALRPEGGGDYEVEYRTVGLQDGVERWIAATGRALFANGRAIRLIGTVRDVTGRKRSEEVLRLNEERYRALVTATALIVWQANAEGGIVGDVPGWEALTGQGPGEYRGRGWAAAIHPDDLEPAMQVWRNARATKTPASIEFRVRRRDGGWRNLLAIGVPVFDARGEVREWIGTLTDITEIRTAERHQRFLMDELNHRVKNTLAKVQAIAAQTLRSAASPEAFREAFGARLLALAKTHNLLSDANWRGAGLRAVIAAELAPHLDDGEQPRFGLAGEDVLLEPRAALALGMIVHELATNAGKYGALSAPAGRIEISWQVTARAGAPTLWLAWVESGGPPVRRPKRHGFGSMLIERSVAHELDGEVDLAFEPNGVRCTIGIPLNAEAEDPRI